MKKLTLAVILAASSFAAAAAPVTIEGLVNTGAGLSAGAQDSNYTVSVLGGSTTGLDGASYVTANTGFPFPYWSANNSVSKWIAPTASQSQSYDPSSNGTYQYHLSFDLTGFNAASAAFSGRFAADNSATVLLNGHLIGSTSGFSSNSWGNFTAHNGFVAGVNSLDFVVTNLAMNGGNPTGLRAEFTSSSVAAAVPEPETYAMLLAGLGLVGFTARRRAAKAKA